MSLANAGPLLQEYGELKSQGKAITERLKELDAEVRPLLEDQGAVVEGNFMFELKVNNGRKTIDKALLIADGIDPEDYSKVGKPFTSLTVKELGNG